MALASARPVVGHRHPAPARRLEVPLAKPCVGAGELEAMGGVLHSGWLGMGPVGRRFEEAVAAFVGARHCVAVSSGTAALHLALEAVGVRGAEVVVPSLTFVATVQAVLAAGGIPVFAECRADDLNIDVDDVARRLTRRTRAVVPVHYAGTPVDMSRLLALARRRSLVVVEDAAHAFGSRYRGLPIGGFGDLTCFSFDPIKAVTCGEGGAVCTGRREWAARIRRLRALGLSQDRWQRRRQPSGDGYEVVEPGYRAHLSDLNAALGLAQMARVDELLESRRRVARRYDAAFTGLPGLVLPRHDLGEQVPFCYTLRVGGGRRAAFRRALWRAGVETAVLYPPNHRQPAFRAYGTALPLTDRVGQELVSIPLFAGMAAGEVDHVIEHVVACCQRHHLSA
jgi:dTDP-4-amino-4,6-dideoxygalactose transaminase